LWLVALRLPLLLLLSRLLGLRLSLLLLSRLLNLRLSLLLLNLRFLYLRPLLILVVPLLS